MGLRSKIRKEVLRKTSNYDTQIETLKVDAEKMKVQIITVEDKVKDIKPEPIK